MANIFEEQPPEEIVEEGRAWLDRLLNNLNIFGTTIERVIGGMHVQTAIESNSFIDQDPIGLGIALQITFGPAETTEFWDVDTAGNFTCLHADTYILELQLSVGRDDQPNESQLYQRILINGTQVGHSGHTIVDNPKIEMPIIWTRTVDFVVDDILTFEIIRDTDGDNSGGLKAGIPDVPGWNDSPSANLLITRVIIGQ